MLGYIDSTLANHGLVVALTLAVTMQAPVSKSMA